MKRTAGEISRRCAAARARFIESPAYYANDLIGQNVPDDEYENSSSQKGCCSQQKYHCLMAKNFNPGDNFSPQFVILSPNSEKLQKTRKCNERRNANEQCPCPQTRQV